YFAAAFNACEQGELEDFSRLSILQAIENYFEQDTLYSFEIAFSSPGEYILHAKRAALPLLVAVCISATSGDLDHDDARSAQIANSVPAGAAVPTAAPVVAGGECVEVQEKYRAIMNAINVDRFNQLCKLNKDAQQGVGLKVDVKQKIKGKK